jgi:cobyrinic acid a,c-diamide synthase
MKLPRLMVAGTGGDCGKTLLTVGSAAAWHREGVSVSPFKKGPDYIDSAWLSLAAGEVTHNLDTWMSGPAAVLQSFTRNANFSGINIIEGNRGLFDGENAQGTHSSAELAKLLKVPIILVLSALKTTRTLAAVALGLKTMDPQVEISGVVLNRVATSRQESIIREAVESETGLRVLGAIPRIRDELLPSRHLGLVTPEEHEQAHHVISVAADIICQYVDLPALRSVANNAAALELCDRSNTIVTYPTKGLRIGYFRSPAFTFYYPENLEAIDRCGGIRVPIDPLQDRILPHVHALYIGGGFPETHAAPLSANVEFRDSVKSAAQSGLPIWAECGGLMFLSRALRWKGSQHPMAGVFPVDVVLGDTPAGHGYEEVVVDRPNPFVEVGTTMRGHEFHYSHIETDEHLNTAFEVKRGTGLGGRRDGMVYKNVLASYLHLHSLATPEWVHWLMNAALLNCSRQVDSTHF